MSRRAGSLQCGMTRLLLPAALALLLAACGTSPSTPSAKASSVRDDADPSVLNRECKLLGTVTGTSLFGLADDVRTANAMNDARERAANMGATHVIFMKADASGMMSVGHATVRAYRCAKPGPS